MALILSNSADFPLPGLNAPQNAGALATPSTLPHISVYETSPKTIKNKGYKLWGKEVGHYLHVDII